MGDMTTGSAVPRLMPAPSAPTTDADAGLSTGPAPSDAPTPPEDPGFKGIRKNGRFAIGKFGPLHAARSGSDGVRAARTATSGEGDQGIAPSTLPGGVRKNGLVARRFMGELHPARTGPVLVGDLISGGTGTDGVSDDFPPFGIRKNGRWANNRYDVKSQNPSPFDVSNVRDGQYDGRTSGQSLEQAIEEFRRQTGMRRNGFEADLEA